MAYNNQKISVIIAARMGSSRFPGKTLSDLYGKPMLERIIERIKFSEYFDEIIVATTNLDEDMILENWCTKNNILCFRGSENDVLLRLFDTAKKFECKNIIEILGDNPLVHSELIDSVIELFFEGSYDYCATLTNEYPKADANLKRFPIGIRVQMFSIEAMEKCNELANTDNYREHATSFIADNPQIFSTGFLEANGKYSDCNYPELTFAVNYIKNLKLIIKIFETLYDKDKNFSISQVIKVYSEKKELSQFIGENK